MSLVNALISNSVDYSVSYQFGGTTYTVLSSDYVKNKFLAMYGDCTCLNITSVDAFTSTYNSYKNHWLSKYTQLLQSVCRQLYMLDGDDTIERSGSKTNTKTNNLKIATNTDIDTTDSGTISNTHKISGMDGGLSDDNTDNGTTTTTNNVSGAKADNYTENTGTVTDVESYTNYVVTTNTNKEKRQTYLDFIREYNKLMVVFDDVITDIAKMYFYYD